MKFCLSSIAGSAIAVTLATQLAHASEYNACNRDSLPEPSKLVGHEVMKAKVAQSPTVDKDLSAATVKDSHDHAFHMDILDIDEYGDEDDGALDESDYNFDEDDEDEDDGEDEGDHDDDDEDARDVTVALGLNGDTHGPEGHTKSAPEDHSATNHPRHPSSDRGFHYADPLMVPPTDQEQCHMMHKRDETPSSEPASIPQDPSLQSVAVGSDKEAQLTALANFEPGGACIDSFVNFALRFRERCTIPCLKTLTHIFAKPDVLGLVGCFGCINFLISGISAVVTDCVGLFTPYPKSPSTTTTKSVPTGSVRKINLADQGVLASANIATSVHPDDQGLGTLDFKEVIQSLQNIDLNKVQAWLDIGKRIVQSEAPAAKDPTAQQGSTKASHPVHDGLTDEEATDKEMFNNFIIKAASFLNWTVTPALLDSTGVYDRVHTAGLL